MQEPTCDGLTTVVAGTTIRNLEPALVYTHMQTGLQLYNNNPPVLLSLNALSPAAMKEYKGLEP